MRQDMGKVITERERHGSSSKSTSKDGTSIPWKGADADYDDQPKRAKIAARSRYGFDVKEPSDVLSPLLGYIRKQVGRPWNKIYSELCENLDKRKLTHAHVFTHVFQEVALHVVRCPDGIYRERDRMYSRLDEQGKFVVTGYASPYYVHPKTGLLRKNNLPSRAQLRAKREKERPRDQVHFSDGRKCQKIDDIWYQVWYVPCRDPGIRPLSERYITNDMVRFWRQEKRQLGKKDLRIVREALENA